MPDTVASVHNQDAQSPSCSMHCYVIVRITAAPGQDDLRFGLDQREDGGQVKVDAAVPGQRR